MKHTVRFSSLALLTVFVLVLSACGPTAGAPVGNAPSTSGGAPKAESAPVEFTGTIESISGNQWTVNGQPVVVEAQALGGMTYNVGDTVLVKGNVAQDGTVTVGSVNAPQAPAALGLAPSNVSASGNSSGTSANSSTNDSADDNGNEQKVTGVVESINGDQIAIDGVTYTVAPGVDLSTIAVGDTVEIEYVANADGTLTATQVSQEDGDDSDEDEDDSDDDEGDSDDDENEDSDDDNSGSGSGNSDSGGSNSGSGGGSGGDD